MKKLSSIELSQKFDSLAGNEYYLLTKPNSTRDYVTVKHIGCGHTYEVKLNNFFNGRRCPNCAKNKKLSHESAYKMIKSVSGGTLELVSPYINGRTPIQVSHHNCNRTYTTYYRHIVQGGAGCPYCNSPSKGEDLVQECLNELGIKSRRQASYPDCKMDRILKFDFEVEVDGKISVIEFDGAMHTLPIFGVDHLNMQQERDKIKNEYCLNNNISLIRIADYDKELIMNTLVSQLN